MYSKSSNNKRIAKNTLFLYVRMCLVLVVSLYSTRVVLQAMGVVDYGIYNVVSGFVTMFAFLNTSLSNGVQRFYNYSLGSKDDITVTDVYNTAIKIQVILAFFLLLLLETFGVWYIYYKMVIPVDRFDTSLCVFHLSVISLLVVVMQVPYSASIMAYERMDYYAYVSIFDVFAKLVIAYAISNYAADRLLLYGFLNLVVTIIGLLLYLIYAKLHFKELKFSKKIRKDLFVPMLSFSGWNVFGSFAYMLKSQGLNMLLNIFFGPVVNAARGISNMIMSAIYGFQTNIVVAFRPQIVQSYACGEISRVEKLFFSLSKVSFVLLTTLSIPLIVEIDFVLHFWLGFDVPEYTKTFTILVLVNMVVSSLNTPVSQVVHATGQMRNYQIGTSVAICSIIPVAWIFLKLGFKATSVYWVSLIVTIFNQILCNYLLKKIFEYDIKNYLKSVIIPCAIFFVLVPVLPYMITKIMSSSLIRVIAVTISSIISSSLLALLIVMNKTEKVLVKSYAYKILSR